MITADEKDHPESTPPTIGTLPAPGDQAAVDGASCGPDQMIMPAATVSLVPGSIRTNEPVWRFRR